MQLKTVRIKSFRSIEDLTLDLNSNLKILVGKNESGKSNIMKALSLLDAKTSPDIQDVRDSLPDEKIPDLSIVWFIFDTNKQEREKIYNNVKRYFDKSINVDENFIEDGNKLINLREFCNVYSSITYNVSVKSGIKYYSSWHYPDEKKKITKHIIKKKTVEAENNVFFEEKIKYNEDIYQPIGIKDINDLHKKEKERFLLENHPQVLYWTYTEENLLPDKIDTKEFALDPDVCKPLKYLFQLAGISDIKKEIENVRKGSSNRYRNFLNKIADHATEHFKNTWKEYQNISFSLEPNGDYIEAGVKEKNTYTFQQRSDGFKRFITFLLMVSINVKNEKLKNTIILVDEPDLSLHPSGVRYLRDELKKISSNNIVIAATHSIFMIDGHDNNNYLIVKKENEKTIIEIPTEKNIATEEVLYRALDFSIYELLKDLNILFEGWRDKRLFQLANMVLSDDLKNFYKNVGVSHTSGVKNVKNITPIFELTGKKCLILSDSDKAARDKQKEFKKERNTGIWLRYDEIDSDYIAITGEDYLTSDAIERTLRYFISLHSEIKSIPDFTIKKGTIANIEHWLKEEKIPAPEVSMYIEEFKTYLFDNIDSNDISSNYYVLLEKMKIYLETHF